MKWTLLHACIMIAIVPSVGAQGVAASVAASLEPACTNVRELREYAEIQPLDVKFSAARTGTLTQHDGIQYSLSPAKVLRLLDYQNPIEGGHKYLVTEYGGQSSCSVAQTLECVMRAISPSGDTDVEGPIPLPDVLPEPTPRGPFFEIQDIWLCLPK